MHCVDVVEAHGYGFKLSPHSQCTVNKRCMMLFGNGNE